MSATIHSRIVDLDEIIPRLVDNKSEDNDVEKLIPWVFQDADIAHDNWVDLSKKRPQFYDFFNNLFTYRAELLGQGAIKGCAASTTGIEAVLKESETITLHKNFEKAPGDFWGFRGLQKMVVRELMETIYYNLEGLKDIGIGFPTITQRLKYVIGGERFAITPNGAVVIGPKLNFLPVLSYTGWFEDQTWNEFLEETLSIMLGQLAKNLRKLKNGLGFQDQEVFVIGFHELSIHLARGVFKTDVISRVHSKGCSKIEVFELQFTRGYNLFLKKDWLEATRAIARFFRYLQSGNAKVGAVQAHLQKVVTYQNEDA